MNISGYMIIWQWMTKVANELTVSSKYIKQHYRPDGNYTER